MSPLPGHSLSVRGEEEAELGVSSLLLAWLPVPWQLLAMPVILGYLGSTWLACSSLAQVLALRCRVHPVPLRSRSPRVLGHRLERAPPRQPVHPSCVGAARSAENLPGRLPKETAGLALSGGRAGMASAMWVVKELLPTLEESSW